MLARFVQVFASRPRPSLLLWLVVLAFGVLSYLFLLPREGFPPVDVPISVGAGGYFVDDKDRVDEEVTVPLADAVLAIEGVESVQSFSRANSFTVLANLEGGVTSVEGAALIEEVAQGISLPPEAQLFTQSIDASKFLEEGYDILIGVYADVGTTGEELEAAAQAIVDDITHPDIASAQVEELFDAGINPESGEEVVLEVSFNQLTDPSNEFRPSIAIGVKASPNVDSIAIRDATDEALERARANLPEGFEAVVAIDFATLVRQQISSLQGNVLLGILVVAIVALLLISWRASIITALFILTVLAASVGGLYIVGISLNTISLFALILALGLFVDDAIVITESIDAFREDENEDDLTVIRRAINRVGSASLSGTLTTVLVFAPMLLIGGVLGGFIRILPITIILSLMVSLILSLIFIPVAARYITLPVPKASGPLVRAEEWLGERVGNLPAIGGGKGLGVAIAGFLLSLVLFFVGLFVFAPNVGFNIFPPAKDSINIALEITYEPGTTIEEAKRIALDMNQQASDTLGDELELGYLYIGDANSALAQYNLTPIGDRPTVHELVDQLQPIGDAEEGARVVFSAISNGPPELLFPYTMQVFGEDIDTLAAAAESLRADLDGRALELPNGDVFNVVETDVALDDVVAREDGRRLVEVRARFDNDSITSVTATTQEFFEDNYGPAELAALGLEEDAIGFDFGLESDNQESFAALPFAFLSALVAMFVLLVIQFRSLVQPLLVFLAIPFSFFGVFGGLLITDNQLSFFVMLGLIGLIGIAVNNSILLVDFANQERDLGADRKTAIATAVKKRFRPLVATSFTTVGGLLPLALSDPFWEGLAFTIIFGLLSSTFLVIVSFPYYYLAVEWMRDKIVTPWRRGRNRTPQPEVEPVA
ncbi:MAG: efflux RND transporter permease subunit [Acidimicrobiia bacterium]|nr:efflux RND transporter permease subunit [Acidimicrobiia bacterium]